MFTIEQGSKRHQGMGWQREQQWEHREGRKKEADRTRMKVKESRDE